MRLFNKSLNIFAYNTRKWYCIVKFKIDGGISRLRSITPSPHPQNPPKFSQNFTCTPSADLPVFGDTVVLLEGLYRRVVILDIIQIVDIISHYSNI